MRPHSNDAPGRRTNARRARGPDRRDPRSEEHTSELQSRLHLVSLDRKSTRLNSSHGYISYAVFCLKKKINAGTAVALAQATGSVHPYRPGAPAALRCTPRAPAVLVTLSR